MEHFIAVIQCIAAVILLLFLTLVAGHIVYKIYRGKIDLTKLISETNGDASMSRFQFLIFTFVIALMWIYVFFHDGGGAIPKLDSSILGLMGISGGSYVLSKGIQKSFEGDKAQAESDTAVAVAAANAPPPPPQPIQQLNINPQNPVQIDPNH